MIHTVKGFGIITEGEVDVFLEFSCFFHDPVSVGSLISDSLPFIFYVFLYFTCQVGPCLSLLYIICVNVLYITCVNPILIIYPLLTFFFGNHKFVFCVSESVSVL